MLRPSFTSRFNKDCKLMYKRQKNMNKLNAVMALLIAGESLHPKHENHPLRGEWEGLLECHIEPDWLLLYEIDPTLQRIIFYRTGSHSDLY